MRKLVKALMLLATACGIVACSEADFGPIGDVNMGAGEPNGEFVTSFGTLVMEQGKIVTDDGLELFVDMLDPTIGWNELESMAQRCSRALFNYTILDTQGLNSYSVRLNRIYEIVVSDIIFYNSTAEVPPTALLCHPATPYQATISGGYVNMRIGYPSKHSPEWEEPMIELHADLTTSTEDTMMMQIVHKATEGFDSPEAKLWSQWFSFRIPEEYLQLVAEADILAFQWCWWADENDYSKGYKMDNVSAMYVDSYGDGGRVMCGELEMVH